MFWVRKRNVSGISLRGDNETSLRRFFYAPKHMFDRQQK